MIKGGKIITLWRPDPCPCEKWNGKNGKVVRSMGGKVSGGKIIYNRLYKYG